MLHSKVVSIPIRVGGGTRPPNEKPEIGIHISEEGQYRSSLRLGGSWKYSKAPPSFNYIRNSPERGGVGEVAMEAVVTHQRGEG